MFALKALSRLVPSVYTTASIFEYGGFQGICGSMQANKSSEELTALAVQVLAVLSVVADCREVASDGTIVDAVLLAMLEYSENPMISEAGREVLNNIATEGDAERHCSNLGPALSKAGTNSDAALKSLAAASGLSLVRRLTPTFENANAVKTILTEIAKIIENPGSLATQMTSIGGLKLSVQEKLMRAGMSTVQVIAFQMSGSLDLILPQALLVAGNDKVGFCLFVCLCDACRLILLNL